jgi:hypothetical protein
MPTAPFAGRPYTLDQAHSRAVVRTRAKGLLARLAHDLEFVTTNLHGSAMIGAAAWSGEITADVDALRVEGVLRGDRVEKSALSASDVAEIERRTRSDVFAGARKVHVEAHGSTRERGDAVVTLGLTNASFVVSIRSVTEHASLLQVRGKCDLSLAALGVREIKGPLGAFKVNDAIEVLFELTLQPDDEGPEAA